MKRKSKLYLFLMIIIICSVISGSILGVLARKIRKQSTEILNYNQSTNATQLNILNGAGDIEVFYNNESKIKIIATLEVRSNSDMEQEIKRKQLVIIPKLQNNILFVESTAKEDGTNYWTWLKKNLNADKTKINYKIYVPASMKTVKIYNAIGNVTTAGVRASLDIEVYAGNIKGYDLIPKDYVNVIVYVGNIQMHYRDISNVKLLQSVLTVGNLTMKIPKKSEYILERSSDDLLPLKTKDVFSENNILKVKENLYAEKQFNKKKTTVIYSVGLGSVSID